MTLQMFRSGSSGNCSVLTVGKSRILIDAGIGPRSLTRELAAHDIAIKDLTAAVFTHCHSDHMRANTLALLGREGVPIYMNHGTWEGARRREGRGELDRIPAGLVRHFAAGAGFEVGHLHVDAFNVDHGAPGLFNHAGDPVGFVFRDEVDTFGYCTDIGHVTETVLAHLKPVDLLVFEYNHDVQMAQQLAGAGLPAPAVK